MPLSHFIAHRIERPTPDAPVTLYLREACWASNGQADECFRELKHCVIKRFSKDYGRFSDDIGTYPLSSWLKAYREESMPFETFTKKVMQQFKLELEQVELPLEGLLFFAHEPLEYDNFVHIFFIQHDHGLYVDGELNLSSSLYLDTGSVNLAARINMTDWEGSDPHLAQNALMLLRWRGEKELSDVFAKVVGFAEKVDLAADTQAFLHVVSDYTKALPEEVANYTKKQVVDYCLEQDKAGQPVKMAALSTELQDNPMPIVKQEGDNTAPPFERPALASFLAETQPEAKAELIPDKTQLRQFVRMSGRDNQLSMSFSSSCLGDSIVYDAENDSLIVNHIPSGLKKRLAEYFSKQS